MSQVLIETIRHSAAHVMAAAVKRLFPGVLFDVGPSVENGFYYDFDLERRLIPEDLERIENEMRRIVIEKSPFVKKILSRDDARRILSGEGQKYKIERLDDVPEGQEISFYECAGFCDLCRGPHVEDAGQIGVFKLLSVAGSYYRGKDENPMLQRIYGTAFHDRKGLDDHLRFLEEAKKRDHRRLGKDLDLFSVAEEVGPGLIIWHPKGARIRNTIENFWREEHYRNGYELLYTPHIGLAKLWETSGHLDFYSQAIYAPMKIDENKYYIKPMNCPFHIQVYKSALRSYRNLPLRWAELGTVYRYEKGGVLHGLLRVRGFTQDDAHIFCAPENIEEEIERALRFSLGIWRTFQFRQIKAYIATRPKKSVGEESRWTEATESLRKAVVAVGIECATDEGGGAFYGPKIDLRVLDALGREWQMSTIQFDFNLPERFDMSFIGSDGQKHRPYMVHRALFGSLERFFGILVEHHAGAFPLWLAPEQIRILPISEKLHQEAVGIRDRLRSAGLICETDLRAEKLGAKIRDARNEKIPYIAVLGDKESGLGIVSVRTRKDGEIGQLTIDAIVEKMKTEIMKKE